MSHSSYTASERRGILAIALLALLLIGGGAGFSLCTRETADAEELPTVVEHTELIDTTAVNAKSDKADRRSQDKKTKSKKLKSKKEKVYRRRSPLDEPV